MGHLEPKYNIHTLSDNEIMAVRGGEFGKIVPNLFIALIVSATFAKGIHDGHNTNINPLKAIVVFTVSSFIGVIGTYCMEATILERTEIATGIAVVAGLYPLVLWSGFKWITQKWNLIHSRQN